jgi:hypothetical protein
MKIYRTTLNELKKVIKEMPRKRNPQGIAFPTKDDLSTIEDDDIIDRLMERALNQQFTLIKRRYGITEAERANYGWGQDDESICTKIYGEGGGTTLTTSWDPKGPIRQKLTHEWSGEQE